MTLIHEKETYEILKACFNVYNEMGCGFLEAVYQECLGIELIHLRIPSEAQKKLSLSFLDQILQQSYQVDFICFGSVVVEIKAVSKLADEQRAQVLNYLHASGFRVALLVNFGHHPKLEYERLVL